MPTNFIDSMASKMESEPIEIPEALNRRAKKTMFLSNLGVIFNFFKVFHPFTSLAVICSALFHLIFFQLLIPEYVKYHPGILIILP